MNSEVSSKRFLPISFNNSSDLFLVVGIVFIIALMILPMPTLMLDILVAVNIIIGIVLLLMGIYVRSAVQFTVFPSILLISTLYRLALSIATTRMILLEGDAGHIIDTFGRVVAGGNLIVGLVVFLIITLVQFIVIAKGAERVAEVGARFSLDAMPGKQMSIDADLRAGSITNSEAIQKRSELELEAKLHGSMDGAMKFVKGDSIAGIVIILINLVGGFAIGMGQLEMSAGDAITKYSLLTVGDGMVAQIPALLGAMAAGLIVTRSGDNKHEKHLGDAISKQLSAIPRVLLVAGAIAFLFAWVPGFPSAVFVVLSFILVLLGIAVTPNWYRHIAFIKAGWAQKISQESSGKSSVCLQNELDLKPSLPIVLTLGKARRGGDDKQKFEQSCSELLANIYNGYGVRLPAINIDWQQSCEGDWALSIYEVPVKLGPMGKTEPVLGNLHEALVGQLALFVSVQSVSQLLTEQSIETPDLIKEVLRVVPLKNITTIIRNLVEERVAIRNVPLLLDTLLEFGPNEKEPLWLAERVRMSFKRETSHRLAPQQAMSGVIIDKKVELALLKKVQANPSLETLFTPDEKKLLLNNLTLAIKEYQVDAVIIHIQLRKLFWRAIQAVYPRLPVISPSEVVNNIDIRVVATLNSTIGSTDNV